MKITTSQWQDPGALEKSLGSSTGPCHICTREKSNNQSFATTPRPCH